MCLGKVELQHSYSQFEKFDLVRAIRHKLDRVAPLVADPFDTIPPGKNQPDLANTP